MVKRPFLGRISTQQTLPYGTPDEVRAEIDRVVACMSQGGGYVTAPAQYIQTDVPLENMLDADRASEVVRLKKRVRVAIGAFSLGREA